MVRTSDAPPPEPVEFGVGTLARTPEPPPLNPALLPTSMYSVAPEVTSSTPLAVAPAPPEIAPRYRDCPSPPLEPVAFTVNWVTPSGTTKVCSAPVLEYVHDTVPTDVAWAHPAGRTGMFDAKAGAASRGAHTTIPSARTTNSAFADRRADPARTHYPLGRWITESVRTGQGYPTPLESRTANGRTLSRPSAARFGVQLLPARERQPAIQRPALGGRALCRRKRNPRASPRVAVPRWNLPGPARRMPRPQCSPGQGRSTGRRLRPLDRMSAPVEGGKAAGRGSRLSGAFGGSAAGQVGDLGRCRHGY